jgi:glycosyltransferase involved in cell wall biosynthesis
VKIAVDARELSGRPTGVGRYLSELLACWGESADASRHQWQLYSHRPVDLPAPWSAALAAIGGQASSSAHSAHFGGGTQWEQWTLPRALARDRPDVLFAPGYTAPLSAPCPVVVTIHDVSFLAHPEWFSRREGTRRRIVTRWAARRAAAVITDSQFSREEIVKFIGIPSTKVRVIPLGMPRATTPVSSEIREPVVLYVGSIFRRRHVDKLIAAFGQVVAPAFPGSRLEIVGENRLYPPGDPATVLRDLPPDIAVRVTLRSYVDEQTLADLYRRASVFAFLSEYEGFGLTPLEALANGLPIVVLDTPIAREVLDDAARFVVNLSPAAIGNALVEMLTRRELRTEVLQRGNTVIARYSWQHTAAATLGVLEAAGA